MSDVAVGFVQRQLVPLEAGPGSFHRGPPQALSELSITPFTEITQARLLNS